MEKRRADVHIIDYRTYIMVWLGLLAFTLISVAASGIGIGGLNVIAPLLIAALKALLVLSFFMHLKYEVASLKIMLAAAVIILAIIIGFTFLDVSFR